MFKHKYSGVLKKVLLYSKQYLLLLFFINFKKDVFLLFLIKSFKSFSVNSSFSDKSKLEQISKSLLKTLHGFVINNKAHSSLSLLVNTFLFFNIFLFIVF